MLLGSSNTGRACSETLGQSRRGFAHRHGRTAPKKVPQADYSDHTGAASGQQGDDKSILRGCADPEAPMQHNW